ncbi:MAG: methyl-accepting chemotaxis protein, partial [Myxococcota bacterium]
ELTQTAKQALGQAEGVMQITEHTIEVARDGKEAVGQVSTGMDEIRQQMETLSERILLLNEQTEQIGDIISSVSEISEQSKLLALNAAIEAARAGEHGRGFAVVATEIRNLADQSKQSTLQVRNILGDIKKATNAAVLATEQGTVSVERGSTLAQTAGERFHELADAVEESGESARLIATISRQQGEGVQQISDAMDDINSNTVQTTYGMTAISDSTSGLSAIAESMRHLISSFVDKDQPVTTDNSPTTDPVEAG